MAATAWNPSDKNTDISLSNGNLTATATVTNWKSVRATDSKSTGKNYFEVTYTTGSSGHIMIGLGTSGSSLNSYVGSQSSSWSWGHGDSMKWHSAASYALGTRATQGQVIMVAWDADAGKMWFGKNGSWFDTGNPGAGTGEHWSSVTGTMFPMLSVYTNGDAATANFGATAFSYTPPSGFSGWYVAPAATSVPSNLLVPSMVAQNIRKYDRVKRVFIPRLPPIAIPFAPRFVYDLKSPVARAVNARRMDLSRYVLLQKVPFYAPRPLPGEIVRVLTPVMQIFNPTIFTL